MEKEIPIKFSKRVSHGHIMADGTIKVFEQYKDPTRDFGHLYKEIILPQKMKIIVQYAEAFRFSHICLHEEVINLLPQIERIEIWPHNEGKEYQEKGIIRESIIFKCKKKINLSFDTIKMHGESIGNCRVSMCY